MKILYNAKEYDQENDIFIGKDGKILRNKTNPRPRSLQRFPQVTRTVQSFLDSSKNREGENIKKLMGIVKDCI